jgi:four helix bundle protein
MAQYPIHQRVFDFVVRILNLTRALPKTPQNLNIIGQISRSATSIGANSQEADGATSKKQFVNSFTIVKKETKETNYWLKMISATNAGFSKRMESLIKEGEELEAIISSILIKSSK